jgi:bifunctional non-homologous end joining protein LigD
VAVSRLEKVYWPGERITKGELLRYYRDLGPTLLPYIQKRPLVMKPFPEGITGPHYFRQNLPTHAPNWLARFETVPVTEQRLKQMPVVDDLPSLIWVVNQGAIELHPWLSTVMAPQLPNLVVLDLDVAAIDRFPLALEAALLVRRALADHQLVSFPKASGSRGVHVYVPVERRYGYEEVRAWVRAFAESIE